MRHRMGAGISLPVSPQERWQRVLIPLPTTLPGTPASTVPPAMGHMTVNTPLITTTPTSHGSSATNSYSPPAQPVSLPNIQIQSASLSAKAGIPGSPITVTADIANKSAVNGNKKVTVYINGQVETTQGVTVNSVGSARLPFNPQRPR
jgi:hypothetical protein